MGSHWPFSKRQGQSQQKEIHKLFVSRWQPSSYSRPAQTAATHHDLSSSWSSRDLMPRPHAPQQQNPVCLPWLLTASWLAAGLTSPASPEASSLTVAARARKLLSSSLEITELPLPCPPLSPTSLAQDQL